MESGGIPRINQYDGLDRRVVQVLEKYKSLSNESLEQFILILNDQTSLMSSPSKQKLKYENEWSELNSKLDLEMVINDPHSSFSKIVKIASHLFKENIEVTIRNYLVAKEKYYQSFLDQSQKCLTSSELHKPNSSAQSIKIKSILKKTSKNVTSRHVDFNEEATAFFNDKESPYKIQFVKALSNEIRLATQYERWNPGEIVIKEFNSLIQSLANIYDDAVRQNEKLIVIYDDEKKIVEKPIVSVREYFTSEAEKILERQVLGSSFSRYSRQKERIIELAIDCIEGLNPDNCKE